MNKGLVGTRRLAERKGMVIPGIKGMERENKRTLASE